MNKSLFTGLITALIMIGCGNKETKMTDKIVCSDNCKAESKDGTKLACKLTSSELRERKETVLASLKSQIIEKKELKNGYGFKFDGSDKMVDELAEFIKTERECCDFFTFNLSIAGDKNMAWLELTGPEGAKDFISSELGL